MINSKTLGIMAIFAASVLVTGALVAAPSYASSNHKDKTVSQATGTQLLYKQATERLLPVDMEPRLQIFNQIIY